MGWGTESTESELKVEQFRGLFDLPAGPGRIGGQLESLLGEGVRGAFGQPLEQALLQPEFGPTTASETAVLESLMDLTAGRGAVRGLGAPTQAGLAQTIAPTLVGMRQQGIQNLMGARAQDVGVRGQDIMGLLELAGLSMPQLIGGQESRGRGTKFGCIITSTCTNPYSYEVNITREFRDKYMDIDTLRGYYRIAEIIVPLIEKHNWLKKLIKSLLIDKLVDYGEYKLGKKEKSKYSSTVIAKGFLGLCWIMNPRKVLIRSNGEVI